MSAEKPKAHEQPTPPRPPKPEVTRENLTAENLTYFTPHSYEDEQAALAIENAPYKLTDKRFNRGYSNWQYRGFEQEPKDTQDTTPPEDAQTPEDTSAPDDPDLLKRKEEALTYMKQWLASGENLDELVSLLWPVFVADNIDDFLAAGAQVDIDKLIAETPVDIIAEKPVTFLNVGAQPNQVLAALSPLSTIEHYAALRDAGIENSVLINRLKLNKQSETGIDDVLRQLAENGVNSADLEIIRAAAQPASASEAAPEPKQERESNTELREALLSHLDELLEVKEHLDKIVRLMWPEHVANNLDKFIAAGANIDVDKLVTDSPIDVVSDNPLKFIAAGASPNAVIQRMNSAGLLKHYDALRDAGATEVRLNHRLDMFVLSRDQIEERKRLQDSAGRPKAPKKPASTPPRTSATKKPAKKPAPAKKEKEETIDEFSARIIAELAAEAVANTVKK